jgi:hypothetical protein
MCHMRSGLRLWLLLATFGACGSPALEADGPWAPPIVEQPVATQVPRSARGYTVVVMPDTQFYAQSFPELFEAQTRWIAANRDALGIAFVLHEGDIVNNDTPLEWKRARDAFRLLDGHVPYALARGNHDLGPGGSRRGGLMERYFSPAEYLGQPWFRETFETGRLDNAAYLFGAGDERWLVLSLEFGARDAALTWASGVLSRHADVPAMVVTHAYLYDDDVRYDRRLTGQAHSPIEMTHLEGGVNDGEDMWQKLVSRHDNVRFVFSGHVPFDGVGRKRSVRPSGTICHELLANYQARERGGDGFLRLLRFEPASKRVYVRTYSPSLNQYKTDPQNEFALEL